MPMPATAPEIDLMSPITIPTGSPRKISVCLWKWVAAESKWILLEDRSTPGLQPGSGPRDPGRFDGQIVRWACEPEANGKS